MTDAATWTAEAVAMIDAARTLRTIADNLPNGSEFGAVLRDDAARYALRARLRGRED